MPGIIQQVQQPGPPQGMPPGGRPQGPPQGGPQGAPQPGGPDFTPANVRGSMHMPPALKPAYEKVVAAGMKVMFDPKTHAQMVQLLQQPGPIEEKLGKGIAGLLLLLFDQSNRTIPPQVMIPAGIELTAHAVDFLQQAGQQVPPQAVAEGIAVMIETLANKFGVDMNKVVSKVGGAQGGTPPNQPAPMPDAPPAPEQAAPEETEGA